MSEPDLLYSDVEDDLRASVRALLGPLAARFHGEPSFAMRVLGVTGTNGKTTITYLLEAIARAAGDRTGVVGTVGARVGDAESLRHHADDLRRHAVAGDRSADHGELAGEPPLPVPVREHCRRRRAGLEVAGCKRTADQRSYAECRQ